MSKFNKDSDNRIMLMSIESKYARQIFNGTKPFEFRKPPIDEVDLNKEIYIFC